MNKYFSIIISLTLIYSNASCSSEEGRSSSGGSYKPVTPSEPVYKAPIATSEPVYKAPIAPSEPVYEAPISSYKQQEQREHLQESKKVNEDTQKYLRDSRNQRFLDGTCKFGEYYNKTSEQCE